MPQRFELIGDERDVSGHLRLAYGSGPDDPMPFVLTLTPQYVARAIGKTPPVTFHETERFVIDGVLCDVVCTGRFYFFFEKRKGPWGPRVVPADF
jgi:hypothetical protein